MSEHWHYLRDDGYEFILPNDDGSTGQCGRYRITREEPACNGACIPEDKYGLILNPSEDFDMLLWDLETGNTHL